MTTLANAAPKAEVAEIVYHGDKLILPNGMGIPAAMKLLESRQKHLETEVKLMRTYDVFPWDGANAINEVLNEKYGWGNMTATPGWFGPTPPTLVDIAVGPNKTKSVPWGRFAIVNVDGWIATGVQRVGNRLLFSLLAQVKRKDEATVQDIFARVQAYLVHHSIYRGKAIKLRFRDDDGDVLEMPEPKFLDTSLIDESALIYSREIADAVDTSLFTPIRRVSDLLALGIPVKRGVLLGGTYGTGKTMAAHVASKIAVQNNITYVYVPRAAELADAIEFAKQYQSPACVVFCEDIDRVMKGSRSVEMDDILNIIDGIDTKSSHIITVLTTNDLSSINPAMLRPGRLDAVIEVTPPDAEAVGRLIRLYAGDMVSPKTDLTRIGEYLAGAIPAVISEAVRRSKLAQLRRTPPGQPLTQISEDALLESARTMQNQLKLLADNSRPKHTLPDIEKVLIHLMQKGAHAANLHGSYQPEDQ